VTAVGPLDSRVVIVTRPPEQSEQLAGKLRERGATIVSAPAIELIPAPRSALDRAARELSKGRYAWALFTSRAGVEAVASALARVGTGFGAISCRLAAVGEGTARALKDVGASADLIPPTFTTQALGRAMPRGTGRVLLARADIAPQGLEEALVQKGWTPDKVDAYRTRRASRLPGTVKETIRAGSVDAVTFTSASTVEGFRALVRPLLDDGAPLPRAVCIGPVTAAAARNAGFRVVAVARPHTIDGLVAAVERALKPRRRKER
jgi:uroporphyrinogen-III synthase